MWGGDGTHDADGHDDDELRDDMYVMVLLTEMFGVGRGLIWCGGIMSNVSIKGALYHALVTDINSIVSLIIRPITELIAHPVYRL